VQGKTSGAGSGCDGKRDTRYKKAFFCRPPHFKIDICITHLDLDSLRFNDSIARILKPIPTQRIKSKTQRLVGTYVVKPNVRAKSSLVKQRNPGRKNLFQDLKKNMI